MRRIGWLALILATGCGEEAPKPKPAAAPPPANKKFEKHGFSFEYAQNLLVEESGDAKRSRISVEDPTTEGPDLSVTVVVDVHFPRETALRDGIRGFKAGLAPDKIIKEEPVEESIGGSSANGILLVYELKGERAVVRYFVLWGRRHTYTVVLSADASHEGKTAATFRPVLQSLQVDR